MPTLSAVNTTFGPSDVAMPVDEQTPTTPRQGMGFPREPTNNAQEERPTPSTTGLPNSDGGAPPNDISASAPAGGPVQEQEGSLKRSGSTLSDHVQHAVEGQDVEMGDEGEDDIEDDDASDKESVNGDSQRPSKKKKGQRFFCTDFPPCQLSFTRSEHLARHIRKHTGERPFVCHCSRRFSRLDNLRQHAQTVHVNEEIPGDSLAATSTRFQRQIRTDRVRPPANRSRTSTLSTGGGHSRGHGRNLSTSSIGSNASSIDSPEDTRRRPPPLAMANDPSARARLSLDTYGNPTDGTGQQYAYYQQSPTGFSTPTSTTFSVDNGSPGFSSGMASPTSTVSRSSFYSGARQNRRLSFPSGPNPYQSPNANTYPPPMYYNPGPPGSSGNFSQNSSVFASPTTSVFSHGRRDSDADMEYRRRTWHPGTYNSYTQRPATSGLSYHQTPDDQRPALSDQPAASQVTRLPGIESFDHQPHNEARQHPSPMLVDSTPRRPSDAGLRQNMTRLDIAAANAPSEAHWQSMQQQPVFQQGHGPQQPGTVAPHHVQPHPTSMPEPVTPRRNKRQAWYGGPVGPPSAGHAARGTHRPSPEDSGSSDGVPTPGTSQGTEYHPVIVDPNLRDVYPHGAVTSDEQKAYVSPTQGHSHPTYALQAGHDPRFAGQYTQPPNNDMGRLEALVAVATSENRAAERS